MSFANSGAAATSAAPADDSLATRGASPLRPRHQITRSLSELSQPSKRPHHRQQQSVSQNRPHHHSHHHHHHHTHHSHLRGGGSAEDTSKIPVPHSAFPALQRVHSRPSLDGHRPAAEALGVHRSSPITSRRASVVMSGDGDLPGRPGTATTIERRVFREEDGPPLSDKAKAEATATSLKTAVVDLSAFSASTTKRLDETYSSVLEKVSILQGTVTALRELSGMWAEVNDVFGRETDELLGEVGSQLEALGDFTPQQRRIESLQTRIHDGRERIQRLSGRVDVVRERIEGWERADREWQERTRRRLKTLWVIMLVAILLVVILLLLVAARYGPAPSLLDVADGSPLTTGEVKSVGEETTLPASERLFRSLSMTAAGGDSSRAAVVDERLRVFDEL